MVQEIITNKLINEMCKELEFYDDNGYFPSGSRRVTFTLSSCARKRLEKESNKSKFINDLIIKK